MITITTTNKEVKIKMYFCVKDEIAILKKVIIQPKHKNKFIFGK